MNGEEIFEVSMAARSISDSIRHKITAVNRISLSTDKLLKDLWARRNNIENVKSDVLFKLSCCEG